MVGAEDAKTLGREAHLAAPARVAKGNRPRVAKAGALRGQGNCRGTTTRKGSPVASPAEMSALLYYLNHIRRGRKGDPSVEEADVRAVVEANQKQRFLVREDPETGVPHVAAWSGHAIAEVVGPAVEVRAGAVPPILVHGTYHRHVKAIRQQGIRAHRRDIHLQDPQKASRKWRDDLQVDTVKAGRFGCTFRLTGNGVWLCSRTIPPDCIQHVGPWDSERFCRGPLGGAGGEGSSTGCAARASVRGPA